MSAVPLQVLLIEDNPGEANLIAEQVAASSTTPFELQWVDRLSAGLARLAKGDIDAVLLDLGLPDSQGLDTFRRVYTQAPLVPILILSGLDDAPLAYQAVNEGAQDYLVKRQVGRLDLPRLLRYAIERKRAESALYESEQRYKRLLESVTDYIYTVKVENSRPVATTHGPSCVAVTGYCPAEFAADPHLWWCMVHGEDRDAVREQAAQILARQEATPLEHRIVHKDGSIRWIRNTPVLHRDGLGRLISYDGLVSDITDRKQAEEELRTSQIHFAGILEAAVDAVISVNADQRIVLFNQGAERIFGHTAAEVLGQSLDMLLPVRFAAGHRRLVAEFAASGGVSQRSSDRPEVVGRRKDGSEFPAEISLSKFELQGEPVLTAMLYDTTERKWAEHQKTQLRIARDIQQKLFPTTAPQLAGFDVAGASYPAEATGGDYFDFIGMPSGTLGIVLGDVSGHGFGPALLATATHACVRTLAGAQGETDIASILAGANRLLFEDTKGEQFVTLLFARLDPQAQSLVYGSAGHPPGFVLDPSGRVKTRLASTGTVLGIAPDETFAAAGPITLAPGELVLFVTDGVEDALAPDDTRFGMDRALGVVRAHQHQSAQEIVEALCRAVLDYSRGGPQYDDITAVVIKVALVP